MRGTTKLRSSAGLRWRSVALKGWLWESRVSEALDLGTMEPWSFLDVWDQGEHPNVVFILEGSFWCNRTMALQRAAAVAAASSSTG